MLSLFKRIPFRDRPPVAIRLVVYRYRASSPAIKRASGRWWDRSEIGMSDPISLPAGQTRS